MLCAATGIDFAGVFCGRGTLAVNGSVAQYCKMNTETGT